MRNAPVIGTAVLLAIVMEARSQSSASQDFTTAHQQYLELNRQIFATPEDPASGKYLGESGQVAAIEGRLHTILEGVIQSVLLSPRPAASDVKAALDEVQGELTPFGWDTDSNMPCAEFFQVNAGESMVVAYGILAGGAIPAQSKAFIEFYDDSSGSWKLQASTGSDFDGTMFSVASIKSGTADEKWILAWGKWFGDTGSRLHIRLYGYNGTSVRTVWKREGLVAGTIKVTPNSVTLEYDKELHSAERIHEVLHVTSNGLE